MGRGDVSLSKAKNLRRSGCVGPASKIPGRLRLLRMTGMALVLAACGGSVSQPTSPANTAPSSSANLAASASASGGAAASSALTPVAVSYSQATAGFGPLYIAKDAGMFQKNGLDVSLKRVTGTSQVPALVANELQIAGVGGTEVINVNSGGGSLVMVATVDDYPTFSLYANKKFKAVTDLAGESIGITTAGSSTDASAQLFLKHYNMLGKVNIVPAGGTIPAILAAVSKGAIAAGMISPPINVEAERQGLVELVNGYKLGEPLNTAGYTVTKAYLSANTDTVRKFLNAYAAGWTYSAEPSNKAEMIRVIGKYTESDAESAQAGYEATLPVWQGKKVPTIDPAGLANIIGLSNDSKVKQAKAAEFFDNALIEAAAK